MSDDKCRNYGPRRARPGDRPNVKHRQFGGAALGSALALFVSLAPASAADVVRPIVSGMTIDTKDNLLQQVAIRVKSLGPGMCSVRVIFASEVQHFGAPPFTWSNWQKLTPAVSGGPYTLDFTPECDGDVLGEVKFVK